MSIFRLALNYLAARRLLSTLTAMVAALGVMLVVAVSALATSTKSSVMQSAGGFQLLVAAKGSPLQAVLSSLFFIEAPTGNIPVEMYRQLKSDKGVTRIVPLNMGDSYRGHTIVATTPDYFAMLGEMTGRAVRIHPENRMFQKPFEALVGATVASNLSLKVGDRFTGIHGLINLPEELAQPHESFPYTVVAVLEVTHTPADKAIFTPLETAWFVHHLKLPKDWEKAAGEAQHAYQEEAEAKELTALLVQAGSYMDLIRLSATLNKSAAAQAVFPARIVSQLMESFKIGESVVMGLSWLVMLVAAFAIMISMLAATIERKREIATLRALGAGRGVIAQLVMLEAGWVGILGAVAGVAAGRGMAYLLAVQIERMSGLHLELLPTGFADIGIGLAAFALSLVAGVVPALLAYRQDVAEHLAPPF